ncbi:MAG: methyltransferase protein [Peltula sp. TS41687]|nr:MAG: methyltransferase protein [Peltula sp. TS41687]
MRLRTVPWIILWDVPAIPSTEGPPIFVPPVDNSLNQSMIASPEISPVESSAPTPAEAAARLAHQADSRQNDPTLHLTYIRHLQRIQPARSLVERFGTGYQDYPQAPLQPLTDNLESVTYEVFERDPVKYNQYEEAITCAVHDWNQEGKPGSGPDGQIVVAVVGAGRGPLVTRALKASIAAGVRIDLWAVEKNPNAYVLLQKHNQDDWASQVTVVKSDMRSWRGPRWDQEMMQVDDRAATSHSDNGDADTSSYGKVDILVSELLGSFGDNELSPECLDGVQHVLNPIHGISIPGNYTAFLTPIAAPRLHAEIRTRSERDPTAPETPYVVFLHSYANLSTSSQHEPIIRKAWEFSHPVSAHALTVSRSRREGSSSFSGGGGGGQISSNNSRDGSNEHNARFTRLTFPCQWRGACDGLAGYFEATLWGDVEISIRPDEMERKSADMTSWFPLFFPLKSPLYFPDNSELEVSIWRQTDDRKVWYEWLVEAFAILDGERIRLGCSELHSSLKHACLM